MLARHVSPQTYRFGIRTAVVGSLRAIWLLSASNPSFLSLPLGWHDGRSFAALLSDDPARGSK
jgi:hypothetical protein